MSNLNKKEEKARIKAEKQKEKELRKEAKKANKQDKLVKTKETKTKRRVCFVIALLTWLLFIASAVYFYYIFQSFKMFPSKWQVWLMYGLGGLAFITALLVFIPKIMSTGKILTSILNVLLSVALCFGSWYLPHIRAQIEIMFEDVPEVGELEINFYALNDTYLEAHQPPQETETTPPADGENGGEVENTETAENTESTETEATPKTIADYKDKTFIIQKSMDKENQDYALLVLKRELLIDDIKTLEVETLWEAADALYAGEGDILVLNTTYIPILQDVTGYTDFSENVDIVYTVKKKLEIATDPTATDLTAAPFSILIAGNDNWGSDIYTYARYDVDMIATVNPITKQVLFTSFPRDSYLPNPALWNADDKLTHMGIYGIQNSVECLSDYMGITIDNYVIVNFTSIVKIINALGGVDINNPYTFTSNSIATYKGTFQAGNIHLTGEMALAYVRERHNLTNGDFDRIAHQDIVIKALVDKITTPAVITQIDSLLNSLSGSFKTNVSIDAIYSLCQMQLDDMALWNMVSYSLSGSTGSAVCASMGSTTKLSVVYLKNSQVSFVKGVMNKVINGEVISQESLPK